MWNGPGQRPRGGAPFRGDHCGEMFGGRDRHMADFRVRDGMNMSTMGHVGPRPLDLPLLDMRRMEGPSMRGRDFETHDVRGREPNRDFFRSGQEQDFNLRRQYDGDNRENMINLSGFSGPGRNSADMGGRGMPPKNRFMDMRERDTFHYDMPRFNNPNMDGRRGFPVERNDGFREMRNRPPMGMGDSKRYDVDLAPRERRMMDSDRRGGPPLNPRGGFDSDTDFRSHHGPSSEFRGRERSPLRFGNSDVPPVVTAKSDMLSDVSGPKRSEFMGVGDPLSEREFPNASDSPLMDYRSGEEMTLAEEWKNRQKDKAPFLHVNKDTGVTAEPSFPGGFVSDVNIRDPPRFQERDRPSLDFASKETGFPLSDNLSSLARPPLCSKTPQDCRHSEVSPLSPLIRENESKQWLGEKDLKHNQKKSNVDERPAYHQEKSRPSQESMDCFNGPARSKMATEHDFQSSSSSGQSKDQDYRDIDYRTASGRAFEYKPEELPTPDKLLQDTKPIIPSKFSESGSQDQDYRNASVEDRVSSTISISGIPKTATMEQILGAFAVCDGVPVQGIRMKNVTPGYSYDTAYVEFLNLEDAVHFMESNKESLKVGSRTVSVRYSQPEDQEGVHESHHNLPQIQESQLSNLEQPSEELNTNLNGSKPKGPMESSPNPQWQRSSDLTPEAWQQQVDQQLQQQEMEPSAEFWGSRNLPNHNALQSDSVFKDSKTMIIKNVKPTTTVETILKALDPFAYLDERNVRLVKAKPPGAKCFCFVDMDSHEQVTRLVELLTKPRPLYIDGVRVYAEVAKPLKNQNFRKDLDKPNSSILGYPPEASMTGQQPFSQPPMYFPPLLPPSGMQGDLMSGSNNPPLSDPSINQDIGYDKTQPVDPLYQPAGVSSEPAGILASLDDSQNYLYSSETPDMSNYLYDATSGFYYDPETTLYYDPNSRYFYNAQNQEYMYWDVVSKTYIPVPGGTSAETQAVNMTAEDQAILSNPAADAPLEMKKPSAPLTTTDSAQSSVPIASSNLDSIQSSAMSSEKREDEDLAKKERDKDEKPKSLAAVKIMKDMERWAKIQNRQKESVRSPSPFLKSGGDDEKRQSKSADAGFAIFERKNSGGDDLFKKPLAPPKKEEKSKRPMGSLGLLASDYAAGSDEEVEEDKEEVIKSNQGSHVVDKDDKLTDWKKMACLLCRRQFPNKDALIRHQQLSDLHKQNMEIHLKIKRSKKELEALENQEKELNVREVSKSPEQKRRKHHHQQPQHHHTWAGCSRESSNERPGLGAEPVQQKRQKKEHVVWDHTTYKQAVRKAMFARFKELE